MKQIGTKTLSTERLTLRLMQPSDAADLFEGGILEDSLRGAEQAVENMMNYNDDPLNFHWILEYEGKAIGRIKVWEMHPSNNYAQLGYDLSVSFRNRGFMTEALKAVLDYLLFSAEFTHVYCMVRASNPSSLRVCQKAGMIEEGRMRKHWVEPDGTFTDVVIYGALAEDRR